MTALLKKITLALCGAMLTIVPASSAWAAPEGALANVPLTATRAVEPNIHLTYDDSDSMNWEMLVDANLATAIQSTPGVALDFSSASQLPIVDGDEKFFWHPADAREGRRVLPQRIIPDAQFDHPTETWDDHFWILRTHEINSLYYNPDITYEPWKGVDETGQPLYQNADPLAARLHPNNPLEVTNLTQGISYANIHANGLDGCRVFRTGRGDVFALNCNQTMFLPVYYIWRDSNLNGRLDSTDAHRLVRIHPDTPATQYSHNRSYAEEIQNFANWFQYYRKREYTAKAALGAVIHNANAVRMGLDALDAGHQSNMATMRNLSNKLGLLRNLYGLASRALDTPTREALTRVGELFRLTSPTVGGLQPPILPAAQGGECQQNFNILMTDGVWTIPRGSVINVGNTDADSGVQEPTDILVDGQLKGFDGNPDQSADLGNYGDTFENTLADIAMHYYETDLQPGLANNVPTTKGVDEAPHQHLVNYAVAFGVQGFLDPSTSPASRGFAWTNPHQDDGRFKIDDLWHAAYNSRGEFLSARNPEQLDIALSLAIDNITDRIASSSSVSVTSARLTTDSVIYRSIYNTSNWTGTISALPIANLDLGILSTREVWNAASVLDQAEVTADNRTILTYHNTAADTSPKDGIPFRWNNLTDTMKADLRVNAAGDPGNDEIAQARLAYIRGDRSNEGSGFDFRIRSSRLGDIVNSGPVFVKEPTLNWPDESDFFPSGTQAYSAFQQRMTTDDPETVEDESRQGVIYVGANDGMIHGFRESDGREILAYIPSNLFSSVRTEGLHYLSHINYQHRFYNDLTPTVSDIYIPINDVADWRTVLIAGQGAGGRGYTALDVTDPDIFSEANAARVAMWEFSGAGGGAGDIDLGYTFSQPQIGVTNDGEWVAVFGNGYNHSGDGQAKLFIVKIAAGLDGTWSAGDYTEISTGVGDTLNRNGLGTPALADTNGDGAIDIAYAGDLFGNLWVFDLSSPLPSTWVQADSVSKLFTTIGGRPITSQPALSKHPTIGDTETNAPNIMVAFGSGQLLVHGDLVTTNAEHFYGVWDKGSANLGQTHLVAQTTTQTTVGGIRVDPTDADAGTTTATGRTLSDNAVDYATKYGWYIHLPITGERTNTDPIIRSNTIFFNTFIPATDICDGSATGFRFAVNLATGGPTSEAVIDINRDGLVDERDRVTTESNAVVAAIKHDRVLTDDTITERHLINQSELIAIQTAPERKTGRLSWQELLQQ